jgi:hypothetical protein
MRKIFATLFVAAYLLVDVSAVNFPKNAPSFKRLAQSCNTRLAEAEAREEKLVNHLAQAEDLNLNTNDEVSIKADSLVYD